jgi:hypothetical protein
MPFGDRTGPKGQGPGRDLGRGGGGRGRMRGNRPGSGPAGNCVCPKCSSKMGRE